VGIVRLRIEATEFSFLVYLTRHFLSHVWVNVGLGITGRNVGMFLWDKKTRIFVVAFFFFYINVMCSRSPISGAE
jgi:hypothetical protein